jgi:hypothetical protein
MQHIMQLKLGFWERSSNPGSRTFGGNMKHFYMFASLFEVDVEAHPKNYKVVKELNEIFRVYSFRDFIKSSLP